MASLPGNGRRRRPSKAAAAALAALLAAGLLSGCGGDSSGSSDSAEGEHTAAPSSTPTIPALPADQPQRPACALVTQAEVEAAIGARVSAGHEQNEEGRSVCSFSLAASTDQSVAVMSTSSSGVPAAFEAASRNASGAQPLNAGDQAFVAGGQALVRKGSTMVAVLVFLRQERAQLANVATKVAQSVATRL